MSNQNTGYDNAQKNHWRRRVWNRFAEYSPKKPRESLALYLSGEDDLDRPIAIERGFRDENLIAVSRSQAAVDSIRANGGLAIKGDVYDVICAWPESIGVDVVHLDTCSPFMAKYAGDLWAIMVLRHLRRSVICLNNVSGHDKDIGLIDTPMPTKHLHRAELTLACAMGRMLVHINSGIDIAMAENIGKAFAQNLTIDKGWYLAPHKNNPERKTCMDWAVFRGIECVGGEWLPPYFVEESDRIRAKMRLKRRRMAQQISAVLAHRTRRLNLQEHP